MPMNWQDLLSRKRLGQETREHSARPGRTEFDSDISRIVFSGAFRRLARKTQVHPLAPNDHVHTRLTHSLEVGQVGRALGRALGEKLNGRLPDAITSDDFASVTQAACLAHDLGNPPFGHAGEKAAESWFRNRGHTLFSSLTDNIEKEDIARYEGNAQGFRIITQTENYLFDGGLRLTYATLASFQKYPWSIRKKEEKFGYYISEEKIIRKISEEIKLIRISDSEWCRHPLAYLVEAADDMCYAIIDIEDAVEMKLIDFKEAKDLFMGSLDEKTKQDVGNLLENESMHRVNLARLRGPIFDLLVKEAISAFIENQDAIMEGDFHKSLFSSMNESNAARNLIDEAKGLARERVFSDVKKTEIEIGSYSVLDSLLSEFCGAAIAQSKAIKHDDEESIDRKHKLIISLLGDHAPNKENPPDANGWTEYQCLRRVLDFVGGMTDNYAIYVSQQLRGAGFSGIQRP